jgi:hypothetical protein
MRIASLHTYPVKGCHRLDHDEARVEPIGLAGDRRWMVVDADGTGVTQRESQLLTALRPQSRPGGLTLRATGGRPPLDVTEPVGGDAAQVRVFRSKPYLSARLADGDAHAWLTALLGRPVRLVWLADPDARQVNAPHARPGDRVSLADACPLLVTTTASLARLNVWLADDGDPPVPMTRFRPNVVVDTDTPWVEDDWIGRRLLLGDTELRVTNACGRCVVTGVDQESGHRGRQPLRALGRHRRVGTDLIFGVHLVPDRPGTVRVGDTAQLLS